jgi:hypothetical protein
MIPELTCEQVEDQLDLYAAKECDLPTRVAIDAHVARCPACAAGLEVSRQLLGLLDLRADEPARLERLREKIDAEAAPLVVLPFRAKRPARVLRFARPLASLAAGLLVYVGLFGLTGPPSLTGSAPMPDVVAAVLIPGTTAENELAVPAKGGPERAFERALKADASARFEVRQARGAPETVGVALRVRNPTDRPLTLWLGGPRTEVDLALTGPRVERRPAAKGAQIAPEWLTLAPRAEGTVTLKGLTAERGGAAEEVRWTRPGDYTLKVRLRVETTEGEPILLTTPPLRARVPGGE